MVNRFSLLGGLAVLTVAVALTGCDPNKDKPANAGAPTSAGTSASPSAPPEAGAGKYKVITNGISPFWDSMGKGLEAAKTELKCSADWQGPSPAENTAQVSLFKTAVASKMDGIGVSVIE